MEDNEKQTEVTTPEGSGEGVQSETVSTLDKADQIAERQARENDRREKILDREEALAARRAVGGTTEAGQPAEVKKETDQEYGERMSGEKMTQ